MNIVVDIGNTFCKIAVFKEHAMMEKVVCKVEAFKDHFEPLLEKYAYIKYGIVSSVGFFDTAILDGYKDVQFIKLTNKTSVPFVNKYSTPLTLGVDRIALTSGAAIKFPKKNVLIIDAGSCITFDFLNSENEYLGGTITPGVQMRYKALHTFTANLPLLDIEIPKTITGDSTASSMHIGAVSGVVYEIDGTIAAYKKQFPDLTVILTGGDTHLLRDRIKNDIFANSNFLLEGLHFILEHNRD